MATLKSMFKLYDGYSNTISKIEKKTDEATDKILKASGATDKFNKDLKNTGASANTASSGLGKFISIAAMVAGSIKGMSIADEYTNTAARLDLINDGLQTQAELQDKIFASADRAKGSYNEMAAAVSKIGLLAGDAFTSNDELIAFTELVQKSFKVGGADTSEQMGAMRQLTQALASGRLQGDELVSIMENAPMLYDAISKYMGLSKGELKELSSEGAITSDIIKNAMFMAGDDINAKFSEMPMTFGDIWNRIKNGGLKAFDKVITKVNQLINTDGFMSFVNGLIGGFNLVAGAVGWFIDVVINGWDIIGPILAIIGAVYLVSIIAKLWAMIPPLVAQAVAWLSIYWPILLVIGVIGIAIAAARHFGASWEDIIGFTGGIIGTFATFFYNKFVQMWNTVAAFINFFGNVFTNPIASIKALFLDLAVNVLGYIHKMAQAMQDFLNNIPFLNGNFDFADKLAGFRDNLATKSVEIKTEADLKTFVQSKEFMDYSEGFEKGSNIGKKLVDKIGNAFDMSGLGDIDKGIDMGQFGSSQNPINVEGEVKVNMSDEDLRYLRDIAERDYINKFSSATLAPNITVSFGDVHEEADADKVAGRIKQILAEEIAMVAEGSY